MDSIYDFGGMYNIDFLRRGNLFEEPLHYQFVFGVLGGIPFSIANLSNLLQLKPPEATWSVCGVANQQFQAALCAASMDGHIRVGLEDNIRTITGELAKGSWEQVEWAANVAKLAGFSKPLSSINSHGRCWRRTVSTTAPGCDTPLPSPVW